MNECMNSHLDHFHFSYLVYTSYTNSIICVPEIEDLNEDMTSRAIEPDYINLLNVTLQTSLGRDYLHKKDIKHGCLWKSS